MPDGRTAVVTLSLCNRKSDTNKIRVMLTDGAEHDAGYIEYDYTLGANAPLERTAIALGAGQGVYAYFSDGDGSAVVFGVEEDA